MLKEAPCPLVNAVSILVFSEQGVFLVPKLIRQYFIAAVVGACLGLILYILLMLLLSVFPKGTERELIFKPFLAVCDPLIDLGASIFGQAPIPIFAFLGFCWSLFGFIAGLLVLTAISRMKWHLKKGSLTG